MATVYVVSVKHGVHCFDGVPPVSRAVVGLIKKVGVAAVKGIMGAEAAHCPVCYRLCQTSPRHNTLEKCRVERRGIEIICLQEEFFDHIKGSQKRVTRF